MANQLERIQRFTVDAAESASLGELQALIVDSATDLGADYFLMIHHADFSNGSQGLVRLGNYPWEFMRISRQDGRPLDDPIMEACDKTMNGFFWSEVGSLIVLSERHHRRIDAVSNTGLGDGFVVPTRVPGEYPGSCHFAASRGSNIPRHSAAALQLLASFGFEAARRLVRATMEDKAGTSTLSDRQRECLILSARGKSDSVIGQLLGLSPKTVNNYVEAAKRRYGVATRTQLIIRALYDSEITFTDIMHALPPSIAHEALH